MKKTENNGLSKIFVRLLCVDKILFFPVLIIFQAECTEGPLKRDPSVASVYCTCDKLVTTEEWGECTCTTNDKGEEVCEQFKVNKKVILKAKYTFTGH